MSIDKSKRLFMKRSVQGAAIVTASASGLASAVSEADVVVKQIIPSANKNGRIYHGAAAKLIKSTEKLNNNELTDLVSGFDWQGSVPASSDLKTLHPDAERGTMVYVDDERCHYYSDGEDWTAFTSNGETDPVTPEGKLCKTSHCNNLAHSKGYCQYHYRVNAKMTGIRRNVMDMDVAYMYPEDHTRGLDELVKKMRK